MIFFKYIPSLALTVVLAACGGGGGSAGTSSSGTVVVAPLQVAAPGALTIAPGAAASYAITGGQAPYSAVSDNSTITQVAVGLGNSLTVGAVTEGTTKVQVRDAKSAVVEITVTVSAGPTVPLFTTAPSALNMALKAEQTFRVVGGKAPYVIASDRLSVATATLIGSSFEVKALAIGVANLKITDSLGATLSVTVNVVSSGVALSVSPLTAQVFVDMPVEFFIVGGTPPYRVAGGIPSVLRTAFDSNNPSKLVVTPLLVSSGLDITILDSQDASTKVTVTAIAGQPTFRLSPSALAVSEKDGSAIVLTTFGASGQLSAFSSDLLLLSATVSSDNKTIRVERFNRCVALDTVVTITVVDANRAAATSLITIKDNGNTPDVTVGGVTTLGNSCPQ